MELNLKGLKQHQLFEPLFCLIPAPGQGHCHSNGQGQGHAPLEQLQPPPPLTLFTCKLAYSSTPLFKHPLTILHAHQQARAPACLLACYLASMFASLTTSKIACLLTANASKSTSKSNKDSHIETIGRLKGKTYLEDWILLSKFRGYTM